MRLRGDLRGDCAVSRQRPPLTADAALRVVITTDQLRGDHGVTTLARKGKNQRRGEEQDREREETRKEEMSERTGKGCGCENAHAKGFVLSSGLCEEVATAT